MEVCNLNLCICIFICWLPITLPNVCKEICFEPLGMESKKIKDNQITASSAFNNDFAKNGPQRARLNLESWPPGYRANPRDARGCWIKVGLTNKKIITGLATQGYGVNYSTEWVTSYIVLYKSKAGEMLPFKTLQGNTKNFTGNRDSSSVKRHDIPFPTMTSEIMILPQTWSSNIGLRLELYGCESGYYFLVWRMFDRRYFTPNHAVTTSDEYIIAKEETLKEIEEHLQVIPGFLSVDFVAFTPHRSWLGETVLTAEAKIFCLKSSEENLEAKLNMDIRHGKAVFRFPLRCNCSYPEVIISLNKTLANAKVLYTTQNITIHATTRRGNCHQSLSFQWEIAKASDHVSEFGMFISRGNAFESKSGILNLSGSEFGEGFLYIRCAAFIRNSAGELVLETYDYGYVRLLDPPLVALINGPTTAIKGNGTVVLDASSSHDPLSIINNNSGLIFSWFCRKMDEKLRSCFGRYSKRFHSTSSILIVDVDYMDANYTYMFELVIMKDRRVTRAFHNLTVTPPYVISLSCVINCGRKVSTNRRLIVEATCIGPFCGQEMSYRWTLYQISSTERGASWLKVRKFRRYVLTNLDSSNIVFSGSKNPLKQSTHYKIVASVRLRHRMIERGEMVFITNTPPHNPYGDLGCQAYPRMGIVLKTDFSITCTGWLDEDLPLTYQLIFHSLEGTVIIAKGNISNFKTKLPRGNQSENFEVKLEAQIFDSFGDVATAELTVQVMPLTDTEVVTEVTKAIHGPNSTTAELLKSGDQQKATLTSYFTLTATDGTGISLVEKNSVVEHFNQWSLLYITAKDEVLRHLAVVQPQLLQEVTQLSAVVIKATRQRENMRVTSLYDAATLLKSMTSHLNTEASNSKDIDEIEMVGGALLNGMSYVFDILTKNKVTDAKHNQMAERIEQNPRLIEESVALVDNLGTALLSTKVVGESEPSVYETNALSMVLDRQTPAMIVRKHLLGRSSGSGVVFPPQAALKFPNHSVDVQMLIFKYNPFYWDNTAKNITSAVIDLSIKRNGTEIHISDLKEPFELFIPLKTQSVRRTFNTFFVKPSETFENIRYHEISIPSEETVAIIDIVPSGNNLLEVFISAGIRPTPENYSFNSQIPHYGNCGNSVSETILDQQCSPYRLLISSSLTGKTGVYYIAILFRRNYSNKGRKAKETDTEGDFSVKRQLPSPSKDTGVRKKRFCVDVKDPPTTPPPILNTVNSAYSLNDVNYTLSVSIISCLYWSKQDRKWTSKGCKVGLKTNHTSLHCLCTHLSTFGGEFFVAPNPIDFDKVWLEFKNLEETGNFVLAAVFSIYGLYVVGLLLARRFDSKDQDKVVANVLLSENNPQEGHHYEIQIQTGIWKGFGTTATVGIDIFGEEGSSGPIILSDSSLYGKLFSRGSVTNFVVFLPCSLGSLEKLLIWHDNFGSSPSWFLQQVIITESHEGKTWYFFANKWIAIERGSGNLCIELKARKEKERAGFRHLFLSKASRGLGDDHLWLSLFTRPPHSSFTRCQRLSCCVSFLFLSMVTNAMFYQFSESPSHTFRVGPMVLSWRQVVIGIQSGLIAIPVNVLLITIFRNVRAHSESYSDLGTTQRSSSRLPDYFVYIAWFLCAFITLSSSAFTVFYGLSWGKDISNQWLTSILTSFFGDIVLTQPMKVILLAMIVSLRTRSLPEKEEVYGMTAYINRKQEYNAPSDHDLNRARADGRKFFRMWRMIKDLLVFLVFVHVLMVVCYSNRDYKRYLVTASVEEKLTGFNEVTDKNSFWIWIRNKLVPGLYNVSWYNKHPFAYEEGFISNKAAFLMGMPRLRQIRFKEEINIHCKFFRVTRAKERVLKNCSPYQSTASEDKNAFYQPGWIPVDNHTLYSENSLLSQLCPKPWRYKSPQTLQTLPYQGYFRTYDGGGYVAYLGYNEISALEIIDNLQNNNWLDESTAAVFIEFSVHEPSSRLFSFARYFYERLPTGGSVTSRDVQTWTLYRASSSFYAVYELLFVILSLLIILSEVKEFVSEGKAYLVCIWNWIRIFQILFSVSAAVLVVLRANETSLYVKRIKTNPFDHSSPDHVVQLCNVENYILAILIFLSTLHLLKLLKLNPQIWQMTKTLRGSWRSLVSFAALLTTSLMAFSCAGFLAFGFEIMSFSSFYQALVTVLQLCIGGNVNLTDVKMQYQLLGSLYIFTLVIWMGLLLVNFVIVIIVEYYREVRTNATSPYASLTEFMCNYFSAKLTRLLKWNVKRRGFKLPNDAYRKELWRREFGAVSQDLHTSLQSLDLESRSTLSLQNFDNFHSYANCQGLFKSISIVNENKELLLNDEDGETTRYWNTGEEDIAVSQSLSLSPMTPSSNDTQHDLKRVFKIRLILKLCYFECSYDLSELEVERFKSNIVEIALELKRMLAYLRKVPA